MTDILTPAECAKLSVALDYRTPGELSAVSVHAYIGGNGGANIFTVGSPRALTHAGYVPLSLRDPDFQEAHRNLRALIELWNAAPRMLATIAFWQNQLEAAENAEGDCRKTIDEQGQTIAAHEATIAELQERMRGMVRRCVGCAPDEPIGVTGHTAICYQGQIIYSTDREMREGRRTIAELRKELEERTCS